jgi:hypothetical protein
VFDCVWSTVCICGVRDILQAVSSRLRFWLDAQHWILRVGLFWGKAAHASKTVSLLHQNASYLVASQQLDVTNAVWCARIAQEPKCT